jgi:hypothetical protein
LNTSHDTNARGDVCNASRRRAPSRPRTLTAGASPLFLLLFLLSPPAPCARAQDATAAEAKPQASPTPAVRTHQAGAVEGAARKEPVALGAISGRVYGDGGEPLAGVTVYAQTRGGGRAGGFRMPQTITTDDDGNFHINGLEPGVYSVVGTLPGYVPVDDETQAARGRDLYRPGDTVTLRLVKGGVITGRVTDASGEPVVALTVRVYRVRDVEGLPLTADQGLYFSQTVQTDDRGVYRVFGLRAGAYVVAGGGAMPWGLPTAFDADAPTFYPSGTRDTAAEVAVRAGQETNGVDIRLRDEPGRRVSGTISAAEGVPAADDFGGAQVTLMHAASGMVVNWTWVTPMEGGRGFSFEGVADGEYDVQAQQSGRTGVSGVSAPLRVTVRGADVTGLRLPLAPLASASGTVRVEPLADAERRSEACKERAPASLLPQETVLAARRDEPPTAAGAASPPRTRSLRSLEAAPDETGSFTFRALEQGRYRLNARPADESLYVRAIQLPDTTATTAATTPATPGKPRPAAPARDSINVRAGQQLTGINVRLAEGAAALSGRLVSADEGAPVASATLLRVHLVPAEREHADEVLRYRETIPLADGTFAFRNLAPGRYHLAVRAATPDAPEAFPRPAAWDAEGRARLRREAEASAVTLDLAPCQRLNDFALRHTGK